MTTKRNQSQVIFNNNLDKSRKEVIGLFMTDLGMTGAGASTYYSNCKNGWSMAYSSKSTVKKTPKVRQLDLFDYHVEEVKEVDVDVFTLVTLDHNDTVVECSSSYVDLQQAKNDCKFDQYIVDKLPEVGDHKSALSIVD